MRVAVAPGQMAVGGNAELGGLSGHDLGQAGKGVLRGGVGRAVQGGNLGVDRGDVDDPTPAGRDHRGQGKLDEPVRRGDVEGQRQVPEVVVEVDERPGRAAAADARVVDENLDRCPKRRSRGPAPGPPRRARRDPRRRRVLCRPPQQFRARLLRARYRCGH